MLPNCDNSAASLAAKPTDPQPVPAPWRDERFLAAAPIDLDIEVSDLLAQGIAVEPKQVGRADLVATGGSQCRREQRHFNLFQNAVIEPGRRHAVRKAG